MEHLDLATLNASRDQILASPRDDGRVELIVRRPAVEERETVDEARLNTVDGLVGDCWRARGSSAGDQFFVDFDLTAANVPPGTRLALGSAVIEVSDDPHMGCRKFVDRFGNDAHRFVNSKEDRALNLRGINAFVVTGGTVRTGDTIRKTS